MSDRPAPALRARERKEAYRTQLQRSLWLSRLVVGCRTESAPRPSSLKPANASSFRGRHGISHHQIKIKRLARVYARPIGKPRGQMIRHTPQRKHSRHSSALRRIVFSIGSRRSRATMFLTLVGSLWSSKNRRTLRRSYRAGSSTRSSTGATSDLSEMGMPPHV